MKGRRDVVWQAFALAAVAVILAGGFGLHSRRLARKLGKAQEQIEGLRLQVALQREALALQSAADPDLAELDRVFNPPEPDAAA